MDIQVSSNFERYLFELYDRDAAAVAAMMRRFRETGAFDDRAAIGLRKRAQNFPRSLLRRRRNKTGDPRRLQ